MGLLGKGLRALSTPDESGLSLADRFAMFASGVDGDLSTAVAMKKAAADKLQQKLVQQAAMQAAGLLSPQTIARQAQIGNADGEDITSAFAPEYDLSQRQRTPQEIAQGLARLAATVPGFNPTPYKDLATLAMPDVKYDRGYGFDGKTGAPVGPFHTELDKGMSPGADGVVRNAPGYVQSAAEAAKAVAAGQEGGKAQFDVIKVDLPDGRTVQMPRDVAVQAILQSLAGGGAGAPGSPAPLKGLGTSQTPAEASGAKIVGDAAATAQTTLPSDLNDIDTAIQNATALRDHPAMGMRTGVWAMVPALPNTSGMDFETRKKQVLGEGWLNARQALKGGGPITDYEGKKAEQAKMRMDSAQNEDDFKSALDDYVAALQRGRKLVQQKAGVPGQGLMSTPQTTGRNGSRIISVGQ